MTTYLISFNDEWVPELTDAQIRAASERGTALVEEMKSAGVFVFADGALDASTVLTSVEPGADGPVFVDGPYVETKEHLGGFTIIQVADDAAAREWAGRMAMALGWPQEVHRFPSTPPTTRRS